MSWEFFTKNGVMKEGIQSAIGDANTLDGLDSTAFVLRAGSTMTGALTLSGAPTAAAHAATKDYVDTEVAGVASDPAKVDKAGDSMSGNLTMSAGNFVILNDDPTLGTHAVRRSWALSTLLPVAGGTVTGDVTFDPAADITLSTTGALNFSDVSLTWLSANVITLGAGNQIRVQQDPVDNNDLARKSYVDGLAGGANSLDELTDVDPGLSPSDGQILMYDGSFDTRWEAVSPTWLNLSGGTMTGDLILDVGTGQDAQITFDNADSSSDTIVESYVGAEANPRMSMNSGGAISWGPGGASAVDITLSRHGAGDMLTLDGNITLPVTSVTFAGSPYTVLKSDRTILANSTGGAVTITLPASHSSGQVIEVKDSGGAAATNNITIARNGSNIDGAAANKVLSANSEAVILVSNGAAWFTLSTSAAGGLDSLADVDTTGVVDGSLLRYEATGTQWNDTANLLFNDSGALVIATAGGNKNELQITSTAASTGITIGADTNLYRDSANTLKTDDALVVMGKLTHEAGYNVKTAVKTANYTVDLTADHIILCDTATAGAGFTITLPASHSEGDMLTIKDSGGQADTKNITIDPTDTDTIDGNTTHTLTTTYEWVTIVSDGTNWNVVG